MHRKRQSPHVSDMSSEQVSSGLKDETCTCSDFEIKKKKSENETAPASDMMGLCDIELSKVKMESGNDTEGHDIAGRENQHVSHASSEHIVTSAETCTCGKTEMKEESEMKTEPDMMEPHDPVLSIIKIELEHITEGYASTPDKPAMLTDTCSEKPSAKRHKADAGTSKSQSVGTKGKAATVSASSKPVNRLAQLKKQKKQFNETTEEKTPARKEKEMTLIDKEINKIEAEENYFKAKMSYLQLKQTNAKLEQLRLIYQIKKLEKERAIPDEQAVQKLLRH